MAATPVYQPADLQTSTSANGTLVLNKPTNLNAGDLMVVEVGANSVSGSWTTIPSGWSTIANGLNNSSQAPAQGIFFKVAGGSEPSTYTFVHSSNQRSVGVASRITGADTVNPIDSFDSSSNNGNSTTIAMGTISPTLSNNLIMVFAGLANTNPTSYSCTNVTSFTQQYTAAAPSTGGQISAATGSSTAAGSATASGTWSSSSQSTGAVISIVSPNNVVIPLFAGATFNLFTIAGIAYAIVAALFGATFSFFTPITIKVTPAWNALTKSAISVIHNLNKS